MAKIPFIVSARAGKLLGRENFSNPEGAIIELVKNSYDADAQNCVVIFDVPFELQTDDEGSESKVLLTHLANIFIVDNGEGMDDTIIKDYWMKIGTGNKESNSVTIKKRVKTGAKGIGRFALDRLGYLAEMWTLPKTAKDNNGFKWKMDWNQFDESDKSISEIKADLDNLKVDFKEILAKEIGQDLGFLSEIFDGESSSGTILKISNLKDQWFDEEIGDVFKSLEALIPPKELDIPFEVILHHLQEGNAYGTVDTAFFNDFDYKLTAKYNYKKLSVEFEITRNELDLGVVRKKFSSIYRNAKAPYDLKTLEAKSFRYSKPIDKLLKWDLDEKNKKLLEEVGSFNLTFYYLKFAVSRKEDYPFKSLNAKERKNVLDKFGGVKIYRDSFRVRPYGDPDNDWLKLGARVAQSPAGAGQRIGDWRVRPEQTAGIITISRNANPMLIDKSDRGSLQENDAYDTFRLIIIQVIHEFELDRSRILNVYYKYFDAQKKLHKEEEIMRRAVVLADRIVLERQNTEEKIYGKEIKKLDLFAEAKLVEEKKVYQEAFIDTFKVIEDERAEQDNEEIVQVRGLASLGLIMSSFSHELKEVRNSGNEVKSLKKIYAKLTPKEKDLLEAYSDGNDIIQQLDENYEKIRHWVDYSLTAIKKDKRKRGKLNFSTYVGTLGTTWAKIFKSRDISLLLEDNTKGQKYSFRAFEMDMDTIFTNLINNSFDSFDALKKVQERIISICLDIINDEIEITYADNGKGLSEIFQEKEEIFLPFTTSKKDRKGNDIGTGLGMYLVKNVVDDNNGEISILSPPQGFAIKLSFPIRKN